MSEYLYRDDGSPGRCNTVGNLTGGLMIDLVYRPRHKMHQMVLNGPFKPVFGTPTNIISVPNIPIIKLH
ncbi:MAG: hypothetical protein K0M39_15670 [Rhizobium sp.]|jgi:hypothetical protein|uniref:hypothetical protein n=1 Tax=Thiobacillus sp. TaxID=924 RepID=UPI0025F3E90E|nr:hypothetical protein [Thiobacillus sp.]MBW8365988.1 hypothetical protein [Rhizobium sp.]